MSSEPVTRIKSKTPVPYELTAIHHDTHDTKTFCFALPDDATLDMLPGDYLYVHATIDGKTVKRPYTPSSMPGTTGYFDLTVKRYETGMMSKYLHDAGARRHGADERAESWRPLGGRHGEAGGVCGRRHGHHPDDCHHSLDSRQSLPVELFLVFANKAEADIIFREEWDEDAREHASFHCYHVLEQPPAGWSQGTGRITEDILREHLPPPGPDTVIFLCGPPPMADALETTLKAIGHSEQAIILP